MTPKIYGRNYIQEMVELMDVLGADLAMTPYEERKALQRERKVAKKERKLDIRQKRADKRSQAY